MFCSQCGASLAEESMACPSCGTRPTAGHADVPAQAAAWSPAGLSAVSARDYSFDARRWTRTDRIVGGATLVLMISLFLPWFSVDLSGPLGGGSASASGTATHGWLWFVFIIALAMLARLVLVAGYGELPVRLPVERLLLAASGLNLLLVLLAFILKPGSGLAGVNVGWGFGAFVAVLAAIAAVAPLVSAVRGQGRA
jgi:hypothetical protein